MTWLAAIFSAVKSLLVSIFLEANKTPGVEHEITMQEGNAKPLSKSYYIGKYRMHNRDKGKE